MADKPLISPENQPTVIAVAFILALLGFGLAIANTMRMSDIQQKLIVDFPVQHSALSKRVEGLEKAVKALEAAPAPAPAKEEAAEAPAAAEGAENPK